MIRKLKNWWLVITGSVLVILDQGFNQINPILVDIGVATQCIGFVKILFFIYAAYKLKNQLPTQNADKLRDIIKTRVAGPGGSNTPPDPDDK